MLRISGISCALFTPRSSIAEPIHLGRLFTAALHKPQKPSATDHSDPLLLPAFKTRPPPASISSRTREPPPRIYTGRISALMARQSKCHAWISREVEIQSFNHYTPILIGFAHWRPFIVS
ncbi:hypothetical protein AVEN_64750-1 [Araneus ventricosus]|uniref:Uncharacterized protein n=1 Tax=Araneus ventricosus TaxID=182803 RepID=A0A4Y2I6U4_ARAVE|nr:hypothetical protein AVEN_64750-1 [Araneus ventricosus]